MLYGRPLKHIRHADDTTITLEPQRFYLHTFWRYHPSAATRTDGLDIQDNKLYPRGSKITKHKMEILITPETIKPQQIYIGRVKLSFHDVLSEPISGGVWSQASYQDAATEAFTAATNPITTAQYPSVTSGVTYVDGADVANREIGGASSGFGIAEFKLDDLIHHFISLKKITVFDQRPLMGERFQRIPAKVKRINPGTYYGIFFFNDSTRGGTPADTQVVINIKEEINELAI